MLRQPFFAGERDLLVSADQLLLISGPSVEYLTGEEEVLVPAGALADGRVAERGTHQALLAEGGLYADMWTRQQAEERDQAPTGPGEVVAGE